MRNSISRIAICLILAMCAAPAIGRTGSTVAIDSDGVLIVNNREVFPIGFTMPPPPGSRTPDGKDAFAELHDAGGSFIRTGPVGHHWDDRAIEEEQQYEDAAARAGLYCMPYLKELAELPAGNERREAMLRMVIGRFKDHPGLGVWKGADEPDWGKLPVDPLVRAWRVIHEMDGHHPVWIVEAPRGTVESMRRYDAAYDISGADVYPISYPPGIHSLQPNKTISMVGDYTRTMRQVCGKKPVWMTLQIAWSGVVKPGKTLRFPTFPQERFMAYEAIINGARGLVFFGGNLKPAMNERDAQLGWNWTFWERVLRPLVEELGPRSPLAPALVAPDSKLPIHVSAPDDIEFIAREAGDDLFLLACKRSGETVQVRFTGLPDTAQQGDVLFESPRHVQANAGGFADWFAPYDVHVYRFRL